MTLSIVVAITFTVVVLAYDVSSVATIFVIFFFVGIVLGILVVMSNNTRFSLIQHHSRIQMKVVVDEFLLSGVRLVVIIGKF